MSIKETPLARQYRQIKDKHPDTILLFRMGDFYETFGDDAVTTARVCGITLTKRNNGGESDTPLAGFPHHQLDNYLPKLVRAGHRVAVCEQLEDPKQAKGIVRRGVVEVVTPGVVLYDKLLDHNANTFLCCLVAPKAHNVSGGQGAWGMALADVSTGTFMAADVPPDKLFSLLESYNPAEILVDKAAKDDWNELITTSAPQAVVSKLESWLFDVEFARTTTLRHVETASLKGFGISDSSNAAVAVGVILHYVSETQRSALPQLRSIRLLNIGDVMVLDQATRRNLEIHQSLQPGEQSGALIGILDRTHSPMGGRMLRWWLQTPHVSLEAIKHRHQAVAAFVQTHDVRAELETFLRQVGDVERLITKVVTDRATARDLLAIKRGLSQIPGIKELIKFSPTLQEYAERIPDVTNVVDIIDAELSEEAPVQFGTGRMFKQGISHDLDEMCDALTNGQQWIKDYQERERQASGISALKVSYNNVFGYYIEVSRTQSSNVPSNYERRQTLANAERYTTTELKQLEQTILSASARVVELESLLLNSLKQRVGKFCDDIQSAASLIATIDCIRSFAQVAVEYEYVQPEMHSGEELVLVGARHPVIERLLPIGSQYVPNTISLDTSERQLLVITGPNMSGKSSYLRQTGLIVFLAHVGSFVPATSALIPITDRIFTRVGAHDNIMAGESTFLVEMQESANIIHNATNKSLILLDEVGRGTATFDGISIAWAIAEYLHEVVGAKTLFATHYHELTALADRFERIANVKVEVVETDGDIVFTHRVVPGSADHSFGIHVAKMAGMPKALLNTASVVLQQLETGAHDPSRAARTSAVDRHMLTTGGQMTLFEVRDDELRTRVRSLDLNSITPLQALQALAELRESLDT